MTLRIRHSLCKAIVHPLTSTIYLLTFLNDAAIVGLSCRTAGRIDSLDSLWDFLLQKKHASSEIPPRRWEPWRQRSMLEGNIFDSVTRKGYFLDDLEGFDAAFFGISPREAEHMDPHQRPSLELTYEGLQNAGIRPDRLAGSDTAAIEAWSGIGTAHHGISNRISAVDAACASSLVALHLARGAIVSGESTLAICSGVNKAGALKADSVCRSFNAAASGYARDGKTRGIMAPNGAAQVDVARQALCRAGNIDPCTVDYIEAHATSTPLGDPVEIKAMAGVYGPVRSPENPCYLGSIKPNVGHLETAAGAINIVKTVLSVQRGIIPPQRLLENFNTNIDWDSSGLKVLREGKIWPENGVWRAAVCSHSYGGSVCHAIIEQAPPKPMHKSESPRQRDRLPIYAASLAHWLSAQGALSVEVSSHECAIRSLRSYATGNPNARTISNRVIRSAALKGVVWVFSGHGAQWPNMGQQLLLNLVFRNKLSEMEVMFLREAGELGGLDKIQMLTYAVQIGLAFVLQAEVGEILGAVVAGCLTSERARSLFCDEPIYICGFKAAALCLVEGKNIVATIKSSPSTCVVSGIKGEFEEYLRQLKDQGIKTWRVETDIAFHSPLLKRLAHDLQGSFLTEVLRDVSYWTHNKVAPVYLTNAVDAAVEHGFRVFLEASTHPIVSQSIKEILEARCLGEHATFGVMSFDEPSDRSIAQAISRLAQLGDGPWWNRLPNTLWIHKPPCVQLLAATHCLQLFIATVFETQQVHAASLRVPIFITEETRELQIEHYTTKVVPCDLAPNQHPQSIADIRKRMHAQSWAPMIDSTAVFVSKDNPPNIGYLLIELEGMQCNDIESESHTGPDIDTLLHQLVWRRPAVHETPRLLDNVILIDLEPKTHKLLHISSVRRLTDLRITDILVRSNAVVLYVPERVMGTQDATRIAHAAVYDAANILSTLVHVGSTTKTQRLGRVPYHSLYRFSRVATSEHSDIWGGLIDHEGTAFPLFAVQRVQEQTVVRTQDNTPRVAQMESLPVDTKSAHRPTSLLPQPGGTYVILEFLVEKGARSIIVVLRRMLPPRHKWSTASRPLAVVLERIQQLKMRGVEIHTLQLNMSSRSASHKLTDAIKRLSPLPVLGVIHAAAVPGFGYIKDTNAESYASVMAPKIAGALALHEVFPPGTLDFWLVLSSISGIIGTLSHFAYAASNAFLDGLAEYRLSQGCNTSNTTIVNSELQAAGMGDITSAEAFEVWQRLSGVNTDHAVVTRLQIPDADEPVPIDLIREVVLRRVLATGPSKGPLAYVTAKIREFLSKILDVDQRDIEEKSKLNEIGMDSFELPTSVPVPRSLFCDCSTIKHLTSGLPRSIEDTMSS
ncbi:polyketide synthase [Bipolaris maydis]|uniref:polyketide synthase n=1 Tax=Cochliobolus heterostrophus TaxID=5016 RepID=UPI0024D56671|nr:polyketide synthase [Bipolaris maydis]KAJ6203647.1 polyketide synthase [Bipolaris maydis]KAJ6267310.1 polyketide synthase [Bipolaris maydis]